jgi:hypothetical protein
MRDANNLIRPDFEYFSDELTKHDRWVLWKLVKKEGKDKLDKVPYHPDGYPFDAHDPENWMSFDDTWRAYDEFYPNFSGVGFVPAGLNNIIGIDWDDCMNGDGQPNPETLKEIHSINSYTEVSPSGEGVRAFAFGDIPTNGKKDDDADFEIYKNRQFLTVTGRPLPGMPTDLEDSTGAVLDLYEKYFGTKPDTKTDNQTSTTDALFDAIAGEKSHDALLRLAARLISKGVSREESLQIGPDIIKARVRSDKQESRLKEWPRMVESAIVKYSPNEVPIPKFQTVSFEQILSKKPRRESLVEDLFDRKEGMVMVGPHGIGKSLLIYQICLTAGPTNITQGLWGKFPIHKPLVSVICQSENDRAGFYTRLQLSTQSNSAYLKGQHNVHVISYENADSPRIRGNLLDANFRLALVDKLQEVGADIVVFDPLISFHEMDENDNTGMRKVLDALQIHILDEANVGAIIPHHPPKGGSGPRGAGAIADWAHTIVEMTYKDPEDDRFHIRMFNEKNRNHKEFGIIWLRKTDQLDFLRCNEPLSRMDQDGVELVVDVLTDIGFANTKMELAGAIVGKTGIKSDKTARKYIDLAVRHEYITEKKKGGRGSSMSYHLRSEFQPQKAAKRGF